MTYSEPVPSLIAVKPTFLRLKLFYAAFVLVIFIASIFLALVMFDNGISFIWQGQSTMDFVIGSTFVLVGIMAVGGSLAIFLPALRQLWLAVQLERKGEVVQGKIFEKYLQKDSDGKHYGFIACVYSGIHLLEQNVTTTVYERLNEGDEIAIRTLPENPIIARLENARD